MSTEAETTLSCAVHIHPEDDHLWAEVEELPGCFASGRNEEELEEALIEAIELYLSTDQSRVQVQRSTTRSVEKIEEQRFLVSS